MASGINWEFDFSHMTAKTKTTVITSAIVVLLAAIPLAFQHRENARLREENNSLRQDIN